MPFTLIQAGASLQFLSESGEITTLTLPSGVTIDATKVPRFEVLNRRVIMVNSPNAPLFIDSSGNVGALSPPGPATAPTIAVGIIGSLNGTYSGVRYTFTTKNTDGDLIGESALSPASNSVTLTNDSLEISNIAVGPSGTTGRRIYRPTAGGATLFKLIDIDNNTTTSILDNTPDSALSIISAPSLGAAPNLYLVKEWKGRLWGVGSEEVDSLRYSQADAPWAWPTLNQINIPIVGGDERGVLGFMVRKEFLGVGKRDVIWYVTGNTPTDFRLVKLTNTVGIESQESVANFQDTIWWLWKDGVYQWDAEGVRNVSEGKVKSWFTTDEYFNRDKFQNAFAQFDTVRMKYRLFLASAGSEVIDRWVEYDIVDRTWWGPHKTAAFDPTCSFPIFDASDKIFMVVGSDDGYLWKERTEATDHLATGIKIDVMSKWHDAGDVDANKHWGRPVIMGKAQAAGVVSFIPYVGYTDAEAQEPMFWHMVEGHQTLDRMGQGMLMRFRLTHDTYNEPVQIHGIELPFNIFGNRARG